MQKQEVDNQTLSLGMPSMEVYQKKIETLWQHGCVIEKELCSGRPNEVS